MQSTRYKGLIQASKLTVTDVGSPKLQLFLCLWFSAIGGIMALLVAVIVGDLGNVSILAYHLFGGSSVGPRSRGTIFLSVTLSLVWFSFLVLPCLLGGLISLLALVDLMLDLTLKGCARFLLSFFRLIVPGIEAHLQESFSLEELRIKVDTPLNFDPVLSIIGYFD